MRVLLRPLALACAALSAAAAASGAVQEPGEPRPWGHADSDVALDERVRLGHLENGLRYAWAAHPEPQERVYLRLHVDVGSYAERDDERGMAHFLEHMAFNGTENYPAGTLVEWFQEHGMEFGADTNAHTSFSETVYKIDLPENDPETLRSGLRVLRDFAGGLLLESEEVDAEKGVIDGEERERDSAAYRVLEQLLDRLYAGTLPSERLPIGESEVRAEFTAESVRAFYEKWYRPELMTLVVVGDLGDLDPTEMIAEIFGDLPVPEAPVPAEPGLGEPEFEESAFAIYDEELPEVTVQVARLRPYEEDPDTVAERQEDLVLSVAHRMLNLRFEEEVKKEDTPYVSAAVGEAGGFEVFEGGQLTVVADPEQWREAVEEAYVQLRLALNYGFFEAELEEVRANLLRSLRESVEREPKEHSSRLRDEILRAVEHDTVPSGAGTEMEIARAVLEGLTVEECLEALRERWRGGELTIVARGGLDLGEDGGARLRAAVQAARDRPLEKPEELLRAEFAYAADPGEAGALVRQEHVEDLDLWQAEFDNGVRVNVKRTDFKERQILIAARIGEGLLAVEDELLVEAAVGGQRFTAGGLEAHTADELRRMHAGMEVGVQFALQGDHAAMAGATTAEDLQRQCELMCAYVQHGGYRQEALVPFQAQLSLIYQQLARRPEGPLLLEFLPRLFHGNLRVSLLGLGILLPQERLAAVTMEGARQALTPTLGDAPIEVTVVGDLDVDEALAVMRRTFGALPDRRPVRPHEGRRRTEGLAQGLRMERTIETADEKATLMMFFPTDDGLDRVRRRHLGFLGQIVRDRLRKVVREELGASYSPMAASDASRTYEGVGVVLIQASGDPEGVEELESACRRVAGDLAQNGVTAEEVERLAEPVRKQLRDARRTNGYWLEVLGRAQSAPETLNGVRDVIAFYEDLDQAALSALAAEYLRPARASTLLVMPARDDAAAEEAPGDGAAGDDGGDGDGATDGR